MEVESPVSAGWMGTSRAGCWSDEVDVRQVREHLGIEFDMSHTPNRSKAWIVAAKPLVRAGLVSAGVPPAEPFYPVMLPEASSRRSPCRA